MLARAIQLQCERLRSRFGGGLEQPGAVQRIEIDTVAELTGDIDVSCTVCSEIGKVILAIASHGSRPLERPVRCQLHDERITVSAAMEGERRLCGHVEVNGEAEVPSDMNASVTADRHRGGLVVSRVSVRLSYRRRVARSKGHQLQRKGVGATVG